MCFRILSCLNDDNDDDDDDDDDDDTLGISKKHLRS